MEKNNSEVKGKRKNKILKSTELVSLIVSTILSESEPGQIIRPTPLAKSVNLSNDSHPHVDTVKAEFNRIGLTEELLKHVKPLKKENEVYALQVLESYEKDIDFIQFKKEIRQEMATLKESLDRVMVNQKKLLSLLRHNIK